MLLTVQSGCFRNLQRGLSHTVEGKLKRLGAPTLQGFFGNVSTEAGGTVGQDWRRHVTSIVTIL